MAKYNGDKMLVIVNGVAIGATRSFTLTMNQTNFDKTTKDSDGYVERGPGNRDWNVTFDGLYDPAGSMNAEELHDILDGRTRVYLEMALIEGGATVFRGYAYTNNVTITAPQGEAISLSGGFEGDGAISKGTVVSS